MSIKFLLIRMFLFLFGSKIFSKMFLQCRDSKTYGRFCEEVYGRDLCQANMVDEEQLQKLISVIDLQASDQVLDLGCGGGFTTEYISDITKAKVLGIDFAKGAIKSARKRTANKSDPIQFKVGNLNKLGHLEKKFDCILAIDTLYFVSDLDKLVKTMTSVLNAKGRIAIFYSYKNGSNQKLETALAASGLEFQSWDFTTNDKAIWERTKIVASQLKEDFHKEGNSEIYRSRIAEAERNLDWHNQGLMSRRLYLARVSNANCQ